MIDAKHENHRPIYKCSDVILIRSRSQYIRCVDTGTSKKAVLGVKGQSMLAPLFPELPLCAPIDIMHQVDTA